MKSAWLAKSGWSRLLVLISVGWLVGWYLLHASEIGLWGRWLLATPSSSCSDMLPPRSAYLSACFAETQTSGTPVNALLRGDAGNFDRYMASKRADVIWLWLAVPIALLIARVAIPWVVRGFLPDPKPPVD